MSASHLASIYGSEQDKVNCSFYLKIGACRHGDRCSRKHIKPQFSQTVVIQNMWSNPAHGQDIVAMGMTPEQLQKQFDEFYEDVFCELVKFGNLLEMHVCDNVGDHLIGNVYARFDWEDEAQACIDGLCHRWFAGRPLFAELSPVTDFREACCRQNDIGDCNRGGFCNFLHRKRPSDKLVTELQAQQRVQRRLFPSARDVERQKELGLAPTNGHEDRDNDRRDRGRKDDDDYRRRDR